MDPVLGQSVGLHWCSLHLCESIEMRFQRATIQKDSDKCARAVICSSACAILHFGPSMLRLHLYLQSNDTPFSRSPFRLPYLIPIYAHMLGLNKTSHQNGNVQLQLQLRLNSSFVLRSTNVLCCCAAPPPAMPSWRPVRSTTAPS